MLLKLIGDALKIQLFEISDSLFDELKSNKELRKEFKIPFVKSEEGETWTKLPTDFKYKDETECKEVFSTIINIMPEIQFGDKVEDVECMQWEEGVEFKEGEEKYAFDDKKYLYLKRNFLCETKLNQGKGSLGIIYTPEKEISINSGFSVVKKRLWFGDTVEDDFQVSYRNDKYGKFNEFIFDSDCGSDSFILETGKVAEWWCTLAQQEMKDE